MERTTIFESAKRTPIKVNLREGFTYRGSEDHQRIAAKVARVLGRRFGVNATAGHAPYHFERGSRQYVSYVALSNSDNLSFRINFEFATDRPSTRIASIDVYLAIESLDEPDLTVTITDPQANIVQIIQKMEDDVLGAATVRTAERVGLDTAGARENLEKRGVDFHEARGIATETRRLQEASKKESIFNFLQTQGGGYADYVRWATSNGEPTGSAAYFQNAKREFEAHGGSVAQRRGGKGYAVQPAEPEEPLWDQEDADVFEELAENEAIEKFEELEVVLRKMAYADPNYYALFVYGSPGVGKSFSVKKVFKEEAGTLKRNGLDIVMKTGAIAGFTGLIQLLFDNRDGKIVILDDNDEILRNRNGANVLKGAMNTKLEDRRVTYTVADKSAFAKGKEEDDTEIDAAFQDDEDLEEAIHVFQRDGSTLFEKALVPQHRILDEAGDVMSAYEDEDLKDFYFRSRIIFISNLLEVPAAIDDRCYTVDMVFTYEQIMEMILKVMDFIEIPGIDRELRLQVYEFLKKNQFAIEYKLQREVQMTFRKFQKACIAWESALAGGHGEIKAKRWAYKQLRGSTGKS